MSIGNVIWAKFDLNISQQNTEHFSILFTDRCSTQSWNTASFLFLLAIPCEKKENTSGSGRVRALNLTVPLGSARVGSDDLGYGPGSAFSLKPVQTSNEKFTMVLN